LKAIQRTSAPEAFREPVIKYSKVFMLIMKIQVSTVGVKKKGRLWIIGFVLFWVLAVAQPS
jgi:hypothetical protein